MMTNELIKPNEQYSQALKDAIIRNDLSKLNHDEIDKFYIMKCNRLGLDYSSQPFQLMMLNGKIQIYMTKTGTDQLRDIRKISIDRVETKIIDKLYIVTVTASTLDNRTDTSTAAIDISGKLGEALANSLMKCETKAKRRVTLSICGAGMLSEDEVDDISPRDIKKVYTKPATINHKEKIEEKTITKNLPLTEEEKKILQLPKDKVDVFDYKNIKFESGKHKGKKFSEVNLHYHAWCAIESKNEFLLNKCKNFLYSLGYDNQGIKDLREGKKTVMVEKPFVAHEPEDAPFPTDADIPF